MANGVGNVNNVTQTSFSFAKFGEDIKKKIQEYTPDIGNMLNGSQSNFYTQNETGSSALGFQA